MNFIKVIKYDFRKIAFQALIVMGAMIGVNLISFLLLSIFNLGGASAVIMRIAAISTEACVSYVILLCAFVIIKNFLKRRDIFTFTNISYNKLIFLRFCEGIAATVLATVAGIIAYSLADFAMFEKYYQFRLSSGFNSAFTGVGRSALYWLFPIANVIFTCLILSFARVFASIVRVIDSGAIGITLALMIAIGGAAMHISVPLYKTEAFAILGRSDLPLSYLLYGNEYNVTNQSFFALTTTLTVPVVCLFNIIGIVFSNLFAHAVSGRKLILKVWDSYTEHTHRKAVMFIIPLCYVLLSVYGANLYNVSVPTINVNYCKNIYVYENEMFEIDYDFKDISIHFGYSVGKKEDVLFDGKNMLIKRSGVYELRPRTKDKSYNNLKIYVLDSTFEDYRPVRKAEDIVAYSRREKMYLANDIVIDASNFGISDNGFLFGDFDGVFANPYGYKITLKNTKGSVNGLFSHLGETGILDSLIIEGMDFEEKNKIVYSVGESISGTVINCTFKGNLVGEYVYLAGIRAERLINCTFVGDITCYELNGAEKFFWIGDKLEKENKKGERARGFAANNSLLVNDETDN